MNQFCQWDGDPTSRGLDFLGFIRTVHLEDRVEELKNALHNVELINADDADPKPRESTFTGAPLTKETKRAIAKVDYYISTEGFGTFPDAVCTLLDQGRLSMDEASCAMAAHIGVGNEILPFLMKYHPDHLRLYTHSGISDLPDEGDELIQSIFTMDMDSGTVKVWWQGEEDSFSFEDLVNLTTDEIDTRMDILELTAYGDLNEEDADYLQFEQ